MKRKIKQAGGMVYVVEYGFQRFPKQLPYFFITGEEWGELQWDAAQKGSNRADCESCGCLHGMIAEQFPELAHLIPHHLSDNTGTPMHYFANAIYFWRIATGRESAPWFNPKIDTPESGRKGFQQITQSDDEIPFSLDSEVKVREWLEIRLHHIQSDFFESMKKAEIKVES